METSPLILVNPSELGRELFIITDADQAQSHARNASNAANAIAASDEHDLAASQFSTAAKDTSNPEVCSLVQMA